MTDPAPSTPRAARWSRVLLLAALLLGIVTMHTLGHPDDSPAGQDAPAAHSVAHGTGGAHGMPPAHGTPVPPAAGKTAVRGPAGGRMAMDPMSVCLAVLLAGISLLSVLALARTAAPAAARRTVRGDRARGGPDPPTGRELLTRMAVLRV
ncbi:DUF6153 family protein [Streptomyces sp. NBC_00536]|uniref:DUF6153 family protein n=1 Tax=Streptomyces sp. NBC_00536 TaxID=2975769 RepID=UPI002E80C340|nr:DUF6153 family protein [Streptomyces sp. NBC_00536]WUC78734.1 DUF6153 family protein [Streptomyces sp. NBC_00536]